MINKKKLNHQKIISTKQDLNRFFETKLKQGSKKAAENDDKLVMLMNFTSDSMLHRLLDIISDLESGFFPTENWLRALRESHVITDDDDYDEYYKRISEHYPDIKFYIDFLLQKYALVESFVAQQLGVD